MDGASPYDGLPVNQWIDRTRELVKAHPLGTKEIVDVVLSSWEAIFQSKIGPHGFMIGKDMFPEPQILGFFLHELIPLELSARHPRKWRRCRVSGEKDLVCLRKPDLSVEIKTSSHKTKIFGNRSFAQQSSSRKKSKDGYYIAVNFEKFDEKTTNPRIRRIRFGWLDHTDWTGQHAPTGQQAHLKPETEAGKLLLLYGVTQRDQANSLP